MLDNKEISGILEAFGLQFQNITNFYDTSHGEEDKRLNYIFQYPNDSSMVHWLTDDTRRSKCAELIRALIDKPL